MTEMTQGMHPAAIEHLPPFITPPGSTDVLFVVIGIFLVMAVIGIGLFYFKLHALPEQLAHRGQKIQFQVVAVLALLALFTHNHLFWVAGLLLALVPFPDFTTPLTSMARSLSKMAGLPDPGEIEQRQASSAASCRTSASAGKSRSSPSGTSCAGGSPCA